MKKSIFALICLFCLINVTTAFASKSPKTSVIIGFKSSINPKTIVSVGGVIKKALKNIPIITADLTDEQIDLLKRDSDIEYVEEDGEWSYASQIYPWGIDRVNAKIAQSQGVLGSGIKVGVVDSGVSSHDDLLITGGWNFLSNNSDFADDMGHGTHVSGIVSA